MNRKRRDNEDFNQYRSNLKKEAKIFNRVILKGRLLWPSKVFGTAYRSVIGGVPYYVSADGRHKMRLR